VLTLFKQHGIKLLKLERENKKTESKEERPPPYAPCCDRVVNQMPLLQGTRDIKGAIEFEGYVHDTNTEEEIDEQSCTEPLSLDDREGGYAHRAVEERLEPQEEGRRTSTPLPQSRQERERTTYREEPRIERRGARERKRGQVSHSHIVISQLC
jgi:hypothetical protein